MESTLIITDGLSPALGFAVIGALGLAMLALALAVRSMIRTTTRRQSDPFVISHIGLPVSSRGLVHRSLYLNASFSATDGAFAALTSVVAVDIVPAPLAGPKRADAFPHHKAQHRYREYHRRCHRVTRIAVRRSSSLHVCGANRVRNPDHACDLLVSLHRNRIRACLNACAIDRSADPTQRARALGHTRHLRHQPRGFGGRQPDPKARVRLPHLARSWAYVGQERRRRSQSPKRRWSSRHWPLIQSD